VTFYRSTDDLPDFLDYTMKNRTYRYFTGKALYPFGYGLSYTTFYISKPKYEDGNLQVSVKNTGKVSGTETLQVYVRNTADKEGPLKTLRGYKQVTLTPGEQQTVSIDLPRESFEGWDSQTNTMRVVPGKYEVMVGNSSSDDSLKKIIVEIN
jgi:beta-glucosidase